MGCCDSKNSNAIIKINALLIPPKPNESFRPLDAPFESVSNSIMVESNEFISQPSKKDLSDSGAFIVHKLTPIKNDYFIGDNICSGGLGSVRFASHRPTKQERAVKTIKKISISSDMRLKSSFFTEIDILKQIDHPNIVKLHEFYSDEQNYYLVFELLKGGDLVSYLFSQAKVPETTAAVFFKQMLSAVSYCHSKGIVHRDLKLEHLMLESTSPNSALKIIDFGSATNYDPQKRLKRKYGSAFYIAPEVLRRDYSEKCDVWSCGVILYIILSGIPPFSGATEEEIYAKIVRGRFSFDAPIWAGVSAEAKELVTKMLNLDENLRISAAEGLEHPWVVKNSQVFSQSNLTTQLMFKNLKQFQSSEKLQRSILTIIASQLLHKEETRQLSELFRTIDKNCDGRIERNELIEEYKKRWPQTRAIEEVDKIMKQVDANNSGYIDYTEFLIATMQKEQLLTRKNVERALKIFASENSEAITIEDLKELLGNKENVLKGFWEGLNSEKSR